MHQTATYDVFGTATSPTTLTAAFVAGNTELALFFKKLSLDVEYTPGENNAYAQILIEYSRDPVDHRTPTNWFPFATAIPATTQVDIYAQGGDVMTTTAGTPINVPTKNTSTAAQVVTAHISPDTDLNANWIRIRCKEIFASTAGTLYVSMNLQG